MPWQIPYSPYACVLHFLIVLTRKGSSQIQFIISLCIRKAFSKGKLVFKFSSLTKEQKYKGKNIPELKVLVHCPIINSLVPFYNVVDLWRQTVYLILEFFYSNEENTINLSKFITSLEIRDFSLASTWTLAKMYKKFGLREHYLNEISFFKLY